MRRLKRAMLVIATGEMLSSAPNAMAQAPTPSLPASAPVTLSSSGPAGNASSQDSKAGAKAPDSAGSAAATAPGAGYTWRDKSARKHHKSHSTKVNPSLSQAKGPEFTLAPDGTSHITVQLSRKVEFKAHFAPRRFIVELPNVQVAVGNDLNPLITTHFATPLQDARLIAEKKGARLVIDLRESVTPQATMKDITGGASILEVVLPNSLRKAAVASDPSQQKGHLRMKPAKKSRVSKDKSATPPNGMGPGL